MVIDIPVHCINQAATAYQVPAALVAAIIHVEGGKVGSATKNANGTYDYGPMQINSIWLKKLKAYGISEHSLQSDACTNIWAGTWILSQKMKGSQNVWHGVANYHSYSKEHNQRYQYKVWNSYKTIVLNSKNIKF